MEVFNVQDIEEIMKGYEEFVAEKEDKLTSEEKVEINVIKGRIEKYQDEMAELDPNSEKSLIKEFEESIKREQARIEELENKNNKSSEEKKNDDIEVTEKRDETIKTLTMSKAQIENKIEGAELAIKVKIFEMKNFAYEYDENGHPVNGAEYKKLDDKVKELTTELQNLREAKTKCEEYLEVLKQPSKEVEAINEILNEKKNTQKEDRVENKEEVVKTEGKDEKTSDKEEEKNDDVHVEEVIEEKESKVSEEVKKSDSSTVKSQVVNPQNKPIVKETRKIEQDESLKKIIEGNTIRISAKDDAVYINGTKIDNIGIASSINERKLAYKRLEINKIISNVLSNSNWFEKAWNKLVVIPGIRRKLDPTVVNAITRVDDTSDTYQKYGEKIGLSLEDYITSICTKESLPVNLIYDLRSSRLLDDIDNKIQKFARHANKITDVQVVGLKESKNIFAKMINGIKRLSLPAKTRQAMTGAMEAQRGSTELTETDRINMEQEKVANTPFKESMKVSEGELNKQPVGNNSSDKEVSKEEESR